VRGLLTIAWQEISKRWVLLPAALALGLVPLVLARVGCYDSYYSPYNAYQNVAAVVQLALVTISYVIAFAIGMGVLGTPLHDGRIAFYFARPVSAIAIVIGKVAGALALIVTMEGLLAMRSLAIQSEDQISANLTLEILVGVAFLGAGLVVGILARSKSRWFIADALGAITVTFEFTKLLDRINIVEMKYRFARLEKARPLFDQVSTLLIGMLAAAIVALFLAAGVAIVIGRTDQERAHRAMSITLWSCLIAIGAIGFAIGQWGLQ